jgi:hypothetical protein
MILGDGCLLKEGRFKLTHCEKQLEYLQWKQKLLNQNGIKTSKILCENVNAFGKTFKRYYFRTSVYKFAKLYRKAIYTPYKDITKKSILNKLTPLGIAIWFMDDGSIHYTKNKEGKIRSLQQSIATGLPRDKNQILIDYFKNTWDINFHINKMSSKYSKQDLYLLKCNTKEARKFTDLIKPYVEQVPCMSYKIKVYPEN